MMRTPLIPRRIAQYIAALLEDFPAVGLLGPRQSGKTTLALAIAAERRAVYLDLESPDDRAKLVNPVEYFNDHAKELVILDEVHRLPELFQSLRGIIDRARRDRRGTGRMLLLGSASVELLRQSGESLAGRIAYVELGGFDALEVPERSIDRLWVRGGFPSSFLSSTEAVSLTWRQNFIKTYLERDVAQFGSRVPAETLRRFWTMLAHNQGELLNASKLAGALGVESKSVARYLDLMADLLLVRRLSAWHRNRGKRLVKSPKTYVRDSGLVHALLRLVDKDDVLGHPVAGRSWEGFVVEALTTMAPTGSECCFYRTATGEEIDLVLELPRRELWAIEIKRSSAPTVEKGFHAACADIKPTRRLVVYPGTETFSLGNAVEAISLRALAAELQAL